MTEQAKDGGKGEAVAWLIDWPDEPELGHYFGEEPGGPDARSRPLGFITAPQAECATSDASAQPVAEVIKWQTFTGHTAWDFKVFDKTIEHGAKLYARPASSDAQAACAPRALTDEQIHEIWVKSTAHTISRRVAVEFARAIEQAMRDAK